MADIRLGFSRRMIRRGGGSANIRPVSSSGQISVMNVQVRSLGVEPPAPPETLWDRWITWNDEHCDLILGAHLQLCVICVTNNIFYPYLLDTTNPLTVKIEMKIYKGGSGKSFEILRSSEVYSRWRVRARRPPSSAGETVATTTTASTPAPQALAAEPGPRNHVIFYSFF